MISIALNKKNKQVFGNDMLDGRNFIFYIYMKGKLYIRDMSLDNFSKLMRGS